MLQQIVALPKTTTQKCRTDGAAHAATASTEHYIHHVRKKWNQ